MFENPGGATAPLPPAADAYATNAGNWKINERSLVCSNGISVYCVGYQLNFVLNI